MRKQLKQTTLLWWVVLSLLGSFSVLARDTFYSHFYWVQHQSNGRIFAEVTRESNKWQVTLFSQNLSKWPRVKKHLFFANYRQLLQWKNKNFKLSSRKQQLPAWEVLSTNNQKWRHRNRNIWTVDNLWNDKWEQRFAEWVQKNIDEDFFYKYGIRTDCADVVIAARWIFARIHHLPVANTVSGTDKLFTQDTVLRSWRKLPRSEHWEDDQLFRTALEYILNATSSWSVQRDSYPLKLTAQALIPGRYIILHSVETSSWHTKLIAHVNYGNNSFLPIFTLASTSPRDLRHLVKEGMLDEGWPIRGVKEIMAFRWPVRYKRSWYLKAARLHRDYSAEQFSGDGLNTDLVFYKALFKRIKPLFSVDSLVYDAILDLKHYVEQRIDIVKQGSRFCATHNCSSGANWEAWSTPSRDHKLEQKIKQYENLFQENLEDRPEIYQQWKNYLSNTFVSIEDMHLSLADIIFIWQHHLYSSDPTVSLKVRWGANFKQKFGLWIQKIRELLQKRKVRVDSTDCSNQDCRTITGNWWDGNTYLIDKQLRQLAHNVRNYCSYFGDVEQCHNVQYNTLSQRVVVGPFSKTVDQLLSMIELFNSDPRASVNHRWGLYHKFDHYHLVDVKNLLVAKNGYALINKQKIINMHTGKLVVEVGSINQLRLSIRGDIFHLYGEQKKVLELYNSHVVIWSGELEGRVKLHQRNSFLFIRSPKKLVIIDMLAKRFVRSISLTEDSELVFTDRYLQINYDEYSELLFFKNIKKSIVLHNLGGELVKVYELNKLLVGEIKSNQDGKPYLFLFNKRQKKLTFPLENSATLNFVAGSKIIYSLDSESTHPKVTFAQLEPDGSFTTTAIQGTFVTYAQRFSNEKVVVSITLAGEWDDDFYERQRLLVWEGSQLLEMAEGDDFQEGSEHFMHYFSGLLTYDHHVVGKLPKMVHFSDAQNSIIWQFQSGHGDLEGAGGIGFLPLKVDKQGEIVPQFSFNYKGKLKDIVNNNNMLVGAGALIPRKAGEFTWVCKKYSK